jgi:hypothetical protein
MPVCLEWPLQERRRYGAARLHARAYTKVNDFTPSLGWTAMHRRLIATTTLALLNLATAPSFAATPDISYLQNELDGRGRCLGTAGPSVAMIACNESPPQQWFVTRGDLPGYNKFHTVADGASVCLTLRADDKKNLLAMENCGKADNQQWYVERLSDVTSLMRLTNRETGATRCLEAVQTGLKMTPCGRRQGGHRWHSNYTPTM